MPEPRNDVMSWYFEGPNLSVNRSLLKEQEKMMVIIPIWHLDRAALKEMEVRATRLQD